MRRREFIAFLGSGLAGWPLAARAQQPAMPVIGYFTLGAPEQSASYVAPAQHIRGARAAMPYSITSHVRGLTIDSWKKPSGLLNRQVGGLCAFENFVHIERRAPVGSFGGTASPVRTKNLFI